MKITLSLEKTSSKNISIMVDAFRASTSIITAMDVFNKVIPAFSPEKAKKIANENKGVLAGERMGATIENFDLGNSPVDIKNYKTELKTLVLTTSNGTRILKNMESTVLIGSFINAKSVAKAALKLANESNKPNFENENVHIDVVMAGWKGNFAIEDFLASGEILYWIQKELETKSIESEAKLNSDYGISEYGQSAILASRDNEMIKDVLGNTRSSKRLKELGFGKDVDFCLKKNISENVAIYKNGVLKLVK